MDVSSFLRGLPGGQTLNSAKDRLLAKGAMTHCNKHIEKYGTVLDLQLDTVQRALSLTLLLKSETSPVEIHVREYAFLTVEDKFALVLDGNKIETSREWLTNLIRDHLGQKRLTVPDHLEWIVKLLN